MYTADTTLQFTNMLYIDVHGGMHIERDGIRREGNRRERGKGKEGGREKEEVHCRKKATQATHTLNHYLECKMVALASCYKYLGSSRLSQSKEHHNSTPGPPPH